MAKITKKKTTVELPTALLKEAMAVSGKNINETITMGLRLIAAKDAFGRLRAKRGSYKTTLETVRDEE